MRLNRDAKREIALTLLIWVIGGVVGWWIAEATKARSAEVVVDAKSPGFTIAGWTATVDPPGPRDGANIQAAIDAMAVRCREQLKVDPGSIPSATVRITGGTYTIDRTIWLDSSFVKLRNGGGGAWIMAGFLDCRPLIVVGIPRPVPDAIKAYRSAAGDRTAFRTKGHARAWGQGTPLGLGAIVDGTTDRFGKIDALTVSAGLIFPGPLPRGEALLGVGSWDVGASPYYLGIPDAGDGPDRVRLKFATVDPANPSADPVNWNIETPAKAGSSSLCEWTIDLAKGKVSTWTNGVQTGSTAIKAGLRLAPNDAAYPFVVNDRGGYTPALGGSARQTDFTLTGFSLSASPRYADGAIGSPQARADGKPIDDRYRLYSEGSDDPRMIARLTMDDANPAEMRIRGGWIAGSCWTVLHVFEDSLLSANGGFGTGFNELSDLRLTGAGAYGANVILGSAGQFRTNRLWSIGGAYGIAGFCGPTYQTIHREGFFSGADSAILAIQEMLTLHDVTFPTSGRVTMHLASTRATIRGGFVQHDSADATSFMVSEEGADGNQFSADDLSIDFEGGTFRGSPFVMRGNPYSASSLSLRNINAGTMGASPLVSVSGRPGTKGGEVAIDGFVTTDSPVNRPAIKAGAGWGGSIAGVRTPGGAANKVESARSADWVGAAIAK